MLINQHSGAISYVKFDKFRLEGKKQEGKVVAQKKSKCLIFRDSSSCSHCGDNGGYSGGVVGCICSVGL